MGGAIVQENELEVDHDQLAGEAAAIELPADSAAPGGAAPAPAAAPATIEQGEPAASWSSVTPGLVVALDLAVCPNWKLSDDEKHELAAALAPVFDQLFPGGIGNERHAPYFRLLAVVLAIAGPRFDRESFRFKPLHERKAKAPSEEGAAAAPGAPESSFVAGAGS